MISMIRKKIKDIGEVVGGATPSTGCAEFWDGEIPWLSPKDLTNHESRYIKSGSRNITEEGLSSCSSRLLPKGTVLFSSRAPIGYIAIAEAPLCTNQGFKSIIPSSEVDSLFLYYLLKYNKKNIESMGSGTTFKEVSASTMRSIEVELPETIEEQRKIASILNSIDSKIELNNQLNDYLEDLTSLLFDHIAKDARGTVSLDSYIDISSGKRPSIKSSQRTDECNIPLLGASSQMGYTNDYLIDGRILVIGRVGTHGIVQRVNGAVWPSDNTLFIQSSYYETAFQLLRRVDYVSLNRGSTQPLITQSDMKAYEVPQINPNSLRCFEERAGRLMTMYDHLNCESRQLADLRDALLPKLMSGEIDVSKMAI